MRIKELLDRIRWDEREDPAAYRIEYLDRLRGGALVVAYPQVVRLDRSFLFVRTSFGTGQVPLHRISRVTKDGIPVWQKRGGVT